MVPGSEILIREVGINPLRNGFLDTLTEMGANLEIRNEHLNAGEPVADIHVVYSSNLKGLEVPEHRSASMIDEYPIAAIAAAFAKGKTRFQGLGELNIEVKARKGGAGFKTINKWI